MHRCSNIPKLLCCRICTFSKSNIFMLAPTSLKILIILRSANLQIGKGEILSFVKMMSQYEFLNTKIIALFFINCFQLIIINGKSVRAELLTKMIILYRMFLKKNDMDQNHLGLQIRNFTKILKNKSYRV